MMTKYYNILSTKIVKEKVDDAMKKSMESENEHGFNICLMEGDITTTNIEKGDKDSVKIENRCPGIKIGSFHVHTRGKNAIPSPTDIANIRQKDEFFCIGVITKGRGEYRKILRCFDNEDFF